MGLRDWFKRREDAEPVPAKIPVDATQRDTIDAVVSIFETGSLPEANAYSKVTVLGDGAGISYGCHQATARSGALEAVIDEFYVRGGQLRIGNEHEPVSAESAKAIAARSARGLTSPPLVSREVRDLMDALEAAGHSPVMRAAQRHVFDRDYWLPAFAQGQELGLRYALSYLTLYDLAIHSGLHRLAKLRPLFPEMPPSRGGGERLWVVGLLRCRRLWLAGSTREIVRKTVYRVDELLDLCDAQRWALELPLEVRGVVIGEQPRRAS